MTPSDVTSNGVASVAYNTNEITISVNTTIICDVTSFMVSIYCINMIDI
jgi:hypothetical protein